jgi:hypothetical protein
MAMQPAKKRETIEAYEARLRRTAMDIPRNVIAKAVASIKERAKAIYLAGGCDRSRD